MAESVIPDFLPLFLGKIYFLHGIPIIFGEEPKKIVMESTVFGCTAQELIEQDPTAVCEWSKKLRLALFPKNESFNYLIILDVAQLNFSTEPKLDRQFLWAKSAIFLSQYLHLTREDAQYLGWKYTELNMAIRGIEKIGNEFCSYYPPASILGSIEKHITDRKLISGLQEKVVFANYPIDMLRSLRYSKLFLGLAVRLDKLCSGLVPQNFRALFPQIPFLP